MLYNQYHSKKRSKQGKGYNEIQLDYEEEAKGDDSKSKKKSKKKRAGSKLQAPVQELLKFIFDMKMIEKSVVKIGLNVKKLPLGKLSDATLKEGYTILKQVETELKKKKPNKETLNQLSSAFYKHIPHDFKFQNMSNFILNTKDKLKEKLSLVENLRDIKVASEITKEAEDTDDTLNELDAQYKKLKCDLKPLPASTSEYKTLMDIIHFKDKHPQTSYYKNMKVLDVFKVDRNGEAKKYKKDIGNRKLLWHGSTFSNWGGILSQGLRIAPPEAPACGYAFGKGIYFADIIHKSIGYTRHHMSGNVGLMALCDVAVGKPFNTRNCDSSLSLKTIPKGTNSTRGMGQLVPSKTKDINGSKLQLGPLVTEKNNGWIGFNEFIVYDVDQVNMKYLFKIKFQ